MRRAIVVLAVVCGGWLAAAAPALGCSCVAIAPETRFDESDAAVIARLVEVVPRSQQVAIFRYRVTAVFKGKRRIEEGQPLSLRSANNSAACGLPQGEGRRYGLFLRRAGGRWNATLCDVTSPRTMREVAVGQASRAIPGCAR